jgi:hypothetical protein
VNHKKVKGRALAFAVVELQSFMSNQLSNFVLRHGCQVGRANEQDVVGVSPPLPGVLFTGLAAACLRFAMDVVLLRSETG